MARINHQEFEDFTKKIEATKESKADKIKEIIASFIKSEIQSFKVIVLKPNFFSNLNYLIKLKGISKIVTKKEKKIINKKKHKKLEKMEEGNPAKLQIKLKIKG